MQYKKTFTSEEVVCNVTILIWKGIIALWYQNEYFVIIMASCRCLQVVCLFLLLVFGDQKFTMYHKYTFQALTSQSALSTGYNSPVPAPGFLFRSSLPNLDTKKTVAREQASLSLDGTYSLFLTDIHPIFQDIIPWS